MPSFLGGRIVIFTKILLNDSINGRDCKQIYEPDASRKKLKLHLEASYFWAFDIISITKGVRNSFE